MVSRFPSGSPISHNSSNHVLASFNHDITRADLVDKVDVIFYDGTDIFAMKSLAAAQGEGENILVVKDPNSNAQIELTIEGNNLIAPITYGLLFDVDYNNQHRKFFEKTSGTYLLKLPLFAAQPGSDPADWIYPVMYVRNHLDELSVDIEFFVPDDQNYVPMCAKADYSDIDVGEWIADMSASKARELIEKVMRLEYFLPDAVTIEITPNDSQVGTIEGDWNLFTDGSVYVPLLLTSRLPDGSPLKVNVDSEDPAIETPKMVCSFNRPTSYAELLFHDFRAVITDIYGGYPQTKPFVKYNEGQYCFGDNEEGGAWVELRNNGTELWAILTGCIWIVGLDNQFKRQLRIVDETGSEDYAFRTILTPDYINDNPYQFVLGFKTDGDDDYIVFPINNSSEIRVWDPTTNSYVYRQSEIQTDGLTALLENMYRLEFIMPYGGIFREQEDMPEDLPNGTFDMFTDSEVIVSV